MLDPDDTLTLCGLLVSTFVRSLLSPASQKRVLNETAEAFFYFLKVYLVVDVCVDGLPFVLSQHVRSLYTFWQR